MASRLILALLLLSVVNGALFRNAPSKSLDESSEDVFERVLNSLDTRLVTGVNCTSPATTVESPQYLGYSSPCSDGDTIERNRKRSRGCDTRDSPCLEDYFKPEAILVRPNGSKVRLVLESKESHSADSANAAPNASKSIGDDLPSNKEEASVVSIPIGRFYTKVKSETDSEWPLEDMDDAIIFDWDKESILSDNDDDGDCADFGYEGFDAKSDNDNATADYSVVDEVNGVDTLCTDDVDNVYTDDVDNLYTDGVDNLYTDAVDNVYTDDVDSLYIEVGTNDSTSLPSDFYRTVNDATESGHLLENPYVEGLLFSNGENMKMGSFKWAHDIRDKDCYRWLKQFKASQFPKAISPKNDGKKSSQISKTASLKKNGKKSSQISKTASPKKGNVKKSS